MHRLELFKKNDQFVQVTIRDPFASEESPVVPFSDGAGEVTLYTSKGRLAKNEDGSSISSFTLSYVGPADDGIGGIYRASIDETFDPPVGIEYYLEVTISGGGSPPIKQGNWRKLVTVVHGKEEEET